MKSSIKILGIILVAGLFFCGTSIKFDKLSNPVKDTSVVIKKNKLAGVWDYTVKDVPPEYSTGVLHITKKKRNYMVDVELTAGTLTAEEVVAKKNKITFFLTIEGQRVDVALEVEGDAISGESSSPDGVFQLQGTRRSS